MTKEESRLGESGASSVTRRLGLEQTENLDSVFHPAELPPLATFASPDLD
jgi:hypothetical protein